MMIIMVTIIIMKTMIIKRVSPGRICPLVYMCTLNLYTQSYTNDRNNNDDDDGEK